MHGPHDELHMAVLQAAKVLAGGKLPGAPPRSLLSRLVPTVLAVAAVIAVAMELLRFAYANGAGPHTIAGAMTDLLLRSGGADPALAPVAIDETDWPGGRVLLASRAAVVEHSHGILNGYFAVSAEAAARVIPLPLGATPRASWSFASHACMDAAREVIWGSGGSLAECDAPAGENAQTCGSKAECSLLLDDVLNSTLPRDVRAIGSLRTLTLDLPLAIHDPIPDDDVTSPHACMVWQIMASYFFDTRGLVETASRAVLSGPCDTGGEDAYDEASQDREEGEAVAGAVAGLASLVVLRAAATVLQGLAARRRLAAALGSGGAGATGGGFGDEDGDEDDDLRQSLLRGPGDAADQGPDESPGAAAAGAPPDDDGSSSVGSLQGDSLHVRRAARALLASMTWPRILALLGPWQACGVAGAGLALAYSGSVLGASPAGLPPTGEWPQFALGTSSALLSLACLGALKDWPQAAVVTRTIAAAAPGALRLLAGVLPIVIGFALFAVAALPYTPRFAGPLSSATMLFAVVNGDAMLETYEHARPPGLTGWAWLTDAWLTAFVLVCLVAALNALIAVTEEAFFSARAAIADEDGGRDMSGLAPGAGPYLPVMLRALLRKGRAQRVEAPTELRPAGGDGPGTYGTDGAVGRSLSDGALGGRPAGGALGRRQASEAALYVLGRRQSRASDADSVRMAAALGYGEWE